MNDINNWSGTGRLGQDVELRYTNGGTAVADLSVAVNKSRKHNDEYVQDTSWVTCTVWGKTAEACAANIGSGSRVAVSGELSMEQWEDNEGNKRSKLKVVANRVLFLDPKGEGQGQRSNQDEAVPM